MAFFDVQLTNGKSLVRGDDYPFLARWKQADVPVDLTNWTGRLELYVPGEDLRLWTVDAVLGGVDGTISWEIPASVTADLPKGELIHQTVLVDSLGKTRTRIRGRLRVL